MVGLLSGVEGKIEVVDSIWMSKEGGDIPTEVVGKTNGRMLKIFSFQVSEEGVSSVHICSTVSYSNLEKFFPEINPGRRLIVTVVKIIYLPCFILNHRYRFLTK